MAWRLTNTAMTENKVEFLNKETATEAYVAAIDENSELKQQLEQVTKVANHYAQQLALAQTKLAAIKLMLGGELQIS